MEYSVGDKIIFNKKYIKWFNSNNYYTTEATEKAFCCMETWLSGRVATIIGKETHAFGIILYYIDIPNTHGYDETLFNKFEVLVEL